MKTATPPLQPAVEPFSRSAGRRLLGKLRMVPRFPDLCSSWQPGGMRAGFGVLCSCLVWTACAGSLRAAEPADGSRYEFRAEHDRDGIGKFYLGREIAHVMGHQAADWLERPERVEEEQPDRLIDALRLKPGQSVADIGAGSGYFTWRLAKQVGPRGRVYAVDIQQEMLDLLARQMPARGVSNVVSVLGSIESAKLPASSIDLALMVDVYHEFSHPYEMIQSICAALKPGGRLVFVEYRLEDPDVPIKRLHKMSAEQVRKEMTVQPLEWVENIPILPRQHILVFRKPARTEAEK